MSFCFFFSSRRRHTRLQGDWSSDVCSSDLDDAKIRRVEAVRPPVSFADLQRMPDDGNRYELYDGELWVVPAPLPIHQIVAARLYSALLEHVRQRGGAVLFSPLDIVLSEYDVVQPDVVYFGPETTARLDPFEYIRFSP